MEELQYDTPEFDPSVGRCHMKLTAQLCVAPNARIESLTGKAGGLNQGLWALHDSSQALILKLIKKHRVHPMVPTETENFLRLSREYPALLHERGLAFPLKIFRCRGPSGNKTHDLVVMRRAGGQSFSEVINRKWKTRQISELMQDFEDAGCFLANMHNKYGLQHGDFQPNNLFYDEANKQFTMIDVADLAPSSTMLIQEGDVEHFSKGVRLLASCLGDQLQADGLRYFKAGYSRCRRANC
jgi:tRNA A-37 threonylcarbamoyl transferase component Bud32